jgi:hypothetical protein
MLWPTLWDPLTFSFFIIIIIITINMASWPLSGLWSPPEWHYFDSDFVNTISQDFCKVIRCQVQVQSANQKAKDFGKITSFKHNTDSVSLC